MIVKMQKVTILVSNHEQESSLRALRKLGVVHIKHFKPPHSTKLSSLAQDVMSLDEALTVIGKDKQQVKLDNKQEVISLAKRVISLAKEKKDLLIKLRDYKEKLNWFKVWGKISLATLKNLNNAGIFIKLYTCTKQDLKRLVKDKIIQVLKEEKNIIYLALITTSPEEKLNFHQVKFPDREEGEVQDAINHT